MKIEFGGWLMTLMIIAYVAFIAFLSHPANHKVPTHADLLRANAQVEAVRAKVLSFFGGAK